MAGPIKIPDFQQSLPVVDKDGRPLAAFLRALNTAFKVLVNNANATNAALEAAGIAQAAAASANAAAATAQNAADETASESSIVQSYVTNFSGASPISVSSTGVVTILVHDRVYGNSTLNPTVAVSGGSLPTGAASTQVVRVYYDDASRAGGAVTYQFTVDPAAAPVQGGVRHVVGAAEVPVAGSSNGGFIRPPGFTNVEP